jgi:hypothetical protein
MLGLRASLAVAQAAALASLAAACLVPYAFAQGGEASAAPPEPANARSQTIAIPPALELPAGGIIFSSRDRVIVDHEALSIGLDRIEIDYLVRNPTTVPQTVVMAFPLPTIDMANLYGADLAIPAYNPDNPTNFVGFWTTLDGVAVEPDVDQRALAIGHIEATATLKALGLPLYPLDPGLSETLATLTPAQRQSLREAQLIETENGTSEPLWALRTIFHWRHVLAGDATVAIKHNYRPVAGSAPWSNDLKMKAKTKYCMADEDIAALDQRKATGRAPTVYWVHYSPGNNAWLKGASTSHALLIERPDGKGVAATCAAGQRETLETGLRIIGAARIDDVDIEVMFVE